MRRWTAAGVALACWLALSASIGAQVLGTSQNITVIDSGTACVTAPTACAIFDAQNATSVALDISGTWTGTLTFEATTNGGTWRSVLLTNPATGAAVSTTTASGTFALVNGGFVQVRARATATVTGTAIVAATRGFADIESGAVLLLSSATSPTAVSSGTGVVDNGTIRTLTAQRLTYSAATTLKTATAAGTGPFFSICGSATKTIRVQQIAIGGTVATGAVYGDVEITKTSAATSSGTPTALTQVPHDSTNAAATSGLLNFYTALATAGTPVGKIASQSAVFPITGTVAANEAQLFFDWTNRQEAQAPTLRGTAQCLEANFGTTTATAPTLTVSVMWTEE